MIEDINSYAGLFAINRSRDGHDAAVNNSGAILLVLTDFVLRFVTDRIGLRLLVLLHNAVWRSVDCIDALPAALFFTAG